MGQGSWREKVNKMQGKNYRPVDASLLVVTLLLVFVGVIMVFSSSAALAKDMYHDTYFFLKKEMVFVLVSLLAMVTTRNIPYKKYWYWVYPILFSCLGLLLVALVIGRGGISGDVRRWIRLGPVSLQPSEMTKLAVVIFAAYMLAKKGEQIKDFFQGFVPVMGVTGVAVLMILAQRDLGSAFMVGFVVLLMIFVAGTRMRYLLGLVLVSLPALYFAVFAVDFRRQRILAFLDPWKHRMDSGFQIIQSFVAFKSGGFSGVGLGDGKQKLFYLPEAHTDFIFSVIGEELGLLGVVTVMFLFTLFIFRGIMITLKARDPFGMYLAFGITCLIGVQAFFNMGMVMGMFPTKGLALPFISYGGSSLLTNLTAVGILLNISTTARGDS